MKKITQLRRLTIQTYSIFNLWISLLFDLTSNKLRSFKGLSKLKLPFACLLMVMSFTQGMSQTMMPLPNFGNTYTGNVRGYWFTAPAPFIITGVRVPADAGTGTQN